MSDTVVSVLTMRGPHLHGGCMVYERDLSQLLSELAQSLASDVSIQTILDHLVTRAVEVLPVTGAGVTLTCAGDGSRHVAASDAGALRFEQRQPDIPGLRCDTRFPALTPEAEDAGLAAVFTFPLRAAEHDHGALHLHRDASGALSAEALAAAQALAHVASAVLLAAELRQGARAADAHDAALRDPLTGLPSRLLLQQRIEHAAQRARRSHAHAAIVFVDLDDSAWIHDTHGREVGDELLRAVAHRLSAVVRPGDTLARLTGDEFVFLCEDLHRPDDVNVLARRVGDAFAAPFSLAGTSLRVTATVGVAFAGPGEDVSDELLVRAGTAVSRAKRDGRTSRHDIDLRDAPWDVCGTLERDLRVAFDEGDLEVAYQPVVRSADGRVTGVEALLRWTHPLLGPVAAASMVAAAERSDLICDIGAWVLERGCRDRSRWLDEHPTVPIDLAVNVSARQLMVPGFSATVRRVLAATGMDPSALVLEVTEGIFLEEGERTMTVLEELKGIGIRLALDDFGTGYSSLGYLRRFPVHIVKIDQAFIADIGQPTGSAIVAAVTSLAHALGLTVTAEGVETRQQRELVSLLGCDAAQGYFYAHPMAATGVAAQLADAGEVRPHLPARDRPLAVVAG